MVPSRSPRQLPANAGFQAARGRRRIGKSPVEPDRGCHVRLVRFRLTVDGCSWRPRLRLDHQAVGHDLVPRRSVGRLPPWRAAAALWTLSEPFERRRALARLLKAACSPAGREFGVCAGSDSTGASNGVDAGATGGTSGSAAGPPEVCGTAVAGSGVAVAGSAGVAGSAAVVVSVVVSADSAGS